MITKFVGVKRVKDGPKATRVGYATYSREFESETSVFTASEKEAKLLTSEFKNSFELDPEFISFEQDIDPALDPAAGLNLA